MVRVPPSVALVPLSRRIAIDKPAIRRPQVMIIEGLETEIAARLGSIITRNQDNGKQRARRGRWRSRRGGVVIISPRSVAGCPVALIASPSARACNRMPVVPSLITLIDAAL